MAALPNNRQLNALQGELGYEFKNAELLCQAVTHRSAKKQNNERLEFLGDSILNFVAASILYNEFDDASEGELSRMRAHLVKGDTLSKIGKELGIGKLLILGAGELKSGGRRRDSIVADAVEAIIGAVYLDSGMRASQGVVSRLLKPRMNSILAVEHLKDPKSRLQEFMQSRKLPLPVYHVEKIEGKEHDRTFWVMCSIEFEGLSVSSKGASRRKAEQNSAISLLDQIKRIEKKQKQLKKEK